jgi:hypothetical protein
MSEGAPDELLAELAKQVQGAQGSASTAQGALQGARDAPIPRTNTLADTIARSLGGLSSDFLGKEGPRQNAEKLIKDEQTMLLMKRAENLEALEKNYERAAARAERLEDNENSIKMREKLENIRTKRAEYTQLLRSAMADDAASRREEAATNLQTQRDTAAMDRLLAGLEGRAEGKQTDLSYLQDQVTTTSGGVKFLDLTTVPNSDRRAALNWASANKIPAISTHGVDKLKRIQDALGNIDSMLAQAESIMPGGPTERIRDFGKRRMSAILQTNDMRAAWGTWRISAIQQLTALAGGMGSGFRINQAEIMQAVKNDIPTLNDTYAVALRKANNIRTMLKNTEMPIIRNDWRNAAQDSSSVPQGNVIDLNAFEKGMKK